VLKKGLLVAVGLAALALPASAGAWTQTTTLVPGVTYTKEVRWTFGGPLVTHVIVAPKPGGLYGLRPVLSQETVLGRETVSSMQRRLAMRGTVAGVNGDFFSWATGRPSGIFLKDGVLSTRPVGERSSLGIAFDGSLRVRRLRYFGSWAVDGFEAHPLEEFNRPLTDRRGVALFSPRWGGRTPRLPLAVDVVLSGFPRAVPNALRRARVVTVRRGGGTLVPAGGAVLQARGFWRRVLLREARPGRSLAVQLTVRGLWEDVADAIGGGPVLVRNGRPVFASGEGFTTSQLRPRHPRTAAGQLADGRVILVAVDGRSTLSAGLRNWQLALELVRLGAVTAMALDAGGSTTLAFNGRVLNRPSDGAERAVADGLMVFYYGAYAPHPRYKVFSPNGDGVADVQRVRAKIVRRSWVDLRVVRPNGTIGWRYRGNVGRRVIAHDLSSTRLRDGRWRWVVEAVDGRGRVSRMVRRFVVNKTLGHLRLSKTRMRVVRGSGGRLGVSVVLTRRSSLRVAVRNSAGQLVRVLASRAEQLPGTLGWRWDGRNRGGFVVRGGIYRIRATATNSLGTISLVRAVRVVR
jgi:hypothetical protein